MKITQTIAYIVGVTLLLIACPEVKDNDLYLYNLGDFVEAAGTWNTIGQTFKLKPDGSYTFYEGSTEKRSGSYKVDDNKYTFESLKDGGGSVTVTRSTSGGKTSFTFTDTFHVNGVAIDKNPFVLNKS